MKYSILSFPITGGRASTNQPAWKSMKGFGDWNAVKKTFFDNGGLLDRLFAQSR